MGKRGPAKTPTKILNNRGSWRAKTRKGEPEPTPGLPEPPSILCEKAKEKWDEIVPLLDEMGILYRIDGDAVARYCEAWAEWCEAQEWIHEKGLYYPLKDDHGNIKCFQQWPQVGIANHSAEMMNKIGAQFGMTPSSRAGLSVDSGSRKNETGKGRHFA